VKKFNKYLCDDQMTWIHPQYNLSLVLTTHKFKDLNSSFNISKNAL